MNLSSWKFSHFSSDSTIMVTAYFICTWYFGDFAVYEGSSFCTMPWMYSVKIYTIILTGLAGLAHLQWKKGLMGLEQKLKINPEEGNI